MRSCVLGVCVTIVLFFPPYFSDSIPEDTQSRQTAWFVVSESDRSELYLEPLAKNVDGHLVPVSNSCIPTDPGHKKLVTENFEAGRPYHMSFRGRFVGSAVFNENREGRLVSSSGKPNLIPDGLSGLATTEANPHSRIERGWAATQLEVAAAKEIATNSLKATGVPPSADKDNRRQAGAGLPPPLEEQQIDRILFDRRKRARRYCPFPVLYRNEKGQEIPNRVRLVKDFTGRN